MDGDVYVLEESNFDKLVLQSKDIWMLEFYAPWCGHCKALQPEWDAAATAMKGQVKFGKIDATVHTNLAQRYGVKGYPTLKAFEYGADAVALGSIFYWLGESIISIKEFLHKNKINIRFN